MLPRRRTTRAGSLPTPSRPYLQWLGSEHHPQPAVLSITQATELGAVYTADEIGAVCDAAHAAGLLVHLDGARIANALVATGTDLPTMVRDTGVDLMTFGLTKDGAMYGETVVFLRPELAERAPSSCASRPASSSSKARFVAAQLDGAARGRPVAAQRGPRQRHGDAAGRRGAPDIPGVDIDRSARGELGVRHRPGRGDRAAAGSGRSSGSGT